MNIDGFTFVAQIINFLILVALLRWFLYTPIVDAMQKRQQAIADRERDAQLAYDAAMNRQRELDAAHRALENDRKQRIDSAEEDADTRRRELLCKAREEVAKQRQQWTENFHREQAELADETQQQTQAMGFSAARAVLRQLAGTTLESQIAASFAEQLSKLDPNIREKMSVPLRDGNSTIIVRSARPLSESDRQVLTRAVQQSLATEAPVDFEIDQTLIVGVEMDAGGYSLQWSAEGLLHELEQRVTT